MGATQNPFSDAEDGLLRQLASQGLKPIAIARRMARPESSVYRRMDTLGLREGQTPKTKRNCMCCNAAFLSDGFHNRLCNRCRQKDAGPF